MFDIADNIDITPIVEEVEKAEQLTFTGAELWDLDANTIPTLVESIIPQTGIFTIVGASDTGKSMLFRQLAICCANGSSFIGFPMNAIYNKALFIATEDDQVATSYLLRKQVRDPSSLKNIRFHFETDNIIAYIQEQLEIEKVDLIIIDAWSDVFGQNLNDSALIRETLNQYRSIANKYKCAIGFLHHTGKRTEKLAPSKNNILSGQGFEAKMRLVIELRNDADNENIKHLCIVKGNYLPKEYKSSSYKLEFNPETFLFTDTGERVPFDELIAPTEEQARREPLLKADEVDYDTHLKVLKEVFKKADWKPKISELKDRISNQYEREFGTTFGGKRVDKYFDYLMNDIELIGKHGKDRSPQAYYYLTTDHPLTTP